MLVSTYKWVCRWKHLKNLQTIRKWRQQSRRTTRNHCWSSSHTTHFRRFKQRKLLKRISGREKVLHYWELPQNTDQHGTSPITRSTVRWTKLLLDPSFEPVLATRTPWLPHNHWIHFVYDKCVWRIKVSIGIKDKENLPDWIVWWKRKKGWEMFELPQEIQLVCSSPWTWNSTRPLPEEHHSNMSWVQILEFCNWQSQLSFESHFQLKAKPSLHRHAHGLVRSNHIYGIALGRLRWIPPIRLLKKEIVSNVRNIHRLNLLELPVNTHQRRGERLASHEHSGTEREAFCQVWKHEPIDANHWNPDGRAW